MNDSNFKFMHGSTEYMDDATAAFSVLAVALLNHVRDTEFDYNKTLGSEFRRRMNLLSRGEVKRLLRNIEKKESNSFGKGNSSFEFEVFAKVLFILESQGFSNVAKDFSIALNRQLTEKMSQKIINENIAESAARKSRSVAASGPRHPQRDEIIDVMRATWRKYPWASKNKMILRVTESYRVAVKTLKTWMSEEGLKPLEKVKNKKFLLVIPDRWKKQPG